MKNVIEKYYRLCSRNDLLCDCNWGAASLGVLDVAVHSAW